MSKPAFTPGPWSLVSQGLRGGTYWSIGRPGAEEPIDIHVDDNGEADARLIAAAPDMYEALENILGLAESYLNVMPDRHGIHLPKLEAARAALSKAGGSDE